MPELRFPNYNDDWVIKRIKNISKKIGDGLHGTPEYSLNSEYHFVNGNNIKNNRLVLFETDKRVSEDIALKNDKGLTHETILISLNGTVGNLGLYNGESIMLGKSIGYIIPKGINHVFLMYLLSTGTIKNHFLRVVTGSTIKNLGLDEIRRTRIRFPSKKEQQKIADFFSVLDSRIEIQEEKVKNLEDQKKGYMQRIFSQEIRFKDENGEDYPEWEEKRLGEISKVTNGLGDVKDSMTEGNYPFFDRSEIIKYMDDYLFDNETIIYSGEGSSFLPRYYKGKYGLHQRCYSLYDFDYSIILPKFLYHSMSMLNNYFLSVAVGSTVKSLRMEHFNNCTVRIPCLVEQQKIANFLSLFDEKIEIEKEILETLQEMKRGFLQKMFV